MSAGTTRLVGESEQCSLYVTEEAAALALAQVCLYLQALKHTNDVIGRVNSFVQVQATVHSAKVESSFVLASLRWV